MAGCGADIEANALMLSLTAGEDFTIPEVDFGKPEFQLPFDPDGPLYAAVPQITINDLTTRVIGGAGVFDSLMDAFKAHLREEMDKNRITGAEYSKAYIALSESAMSQSVAFLLGKDQAFWQAQTAQFQAITARVEMESSKIRAAAIQLEALNTKANFALTKMKIASEEIGICTAKYNLDNIMPEQLAKLELEKAGQDLENSTLSFTLTSTLPKQLEMLTTQLAGQVIGNSTATYNLSTTLPQQLALLEGQEAMIKEQTESQRAQTSETRTDGQAVRGVLGKQKDLYTQQITSYQRDAEVKAGKLFTDAWITMKSIDEGLLPPNGFTNASVDTVLTAIKTNNELN